MARVIRPDVDDNVYEIETTVQAVRDWFDCGSQGDQFQEAMDNALDQAQGEAMTKRSETYVVIRIKPEAD